MALNLRGVCALLSVYDMPTAVRFYCDVLGFAIEQRSPTYATEDGVELFHWCMLKNGEATIMLNTAYDTGKAPPERPPFAEGPYGVWFFYGCPDVDGAYEYLKAKGVKCDRPKIVPYGFKTISFRDPDGYGVTLQWPAE